MTDETTRPTALRRGLAIALPVIVLAAGAAAAYWILQSRPEAPRAPAQERQARLVTVTPAEIAPDTLTLTAHGTVEAADATNLRPRVTGQIVALNNKLAPGTRFEKGETLARLDDADYRLALESARTELANTKAALRVEEGQQAVAERELALVDSEVSETERDLALRGPQLEQAKADVDAARTAVRQARLDLERTTVAAPFDGIVTQRNASIGDVVGPSDSLATLAATDVYWVNVSLPVDQLRWLRAAGEDGEGSSARIRYPEAWGADASLTAEVLRIQPALETEGRMARVLLRVPDPLAQKAEAGPGLLLGAYVDADIQADIPGGSVLIDSAFLHENDHVWVMRQDDTLDIRRVDVVYRDADTAVITGGLEPGESVLTSEITGAIQGMPLRTTADEPSDDADGNAEPAAESAESTGDAPAAAS